MPENTEQCTLFKSINPFNEEIDQRNRWMKLSQLVPWDELNAIYLEYFSPKRHEVIKKCRLVTGLFLGQMIMQLSDREVVRYFHENPYFQYFCGQPYVVFNTDNLILHPSLLAKRRKRLGPDCLEKFEKVIANVFKAIGKSVGKSMMADATVFPSNINYPNDVKLLNTVREWLCENILVIKNKIDPPRKIRTYRRVARKDFLNFQKTKRKHAKFIRSSRKKMLNYVRRNLQQINHLLSELKTKNNPIGELSEAALENINNKLETAQKIYEQQYSMATTRGRSTPNRIVSFHQPAIRPVVRGKEGKAVEFGPKCHITYSDGYASLHKFDFNPFNEGVILQDAIQDHFDRFDRNPDSVMADQIYANRKNRAQLIELQIESSFKEIGRQSKKPSPEKRRSRDKIKMLQRKRNAIEGLFGLLKEHFNLRRIVCKTVESSKFQVLMGLMAFNFTQILS